MKVELEINDTQLQSLDKDLTTFLSTLDDSQKLTLLGKYVEHQLNDLYEDRGWSGKELTEFGKQLIGHLREQIKNLYIENYYLNNEELKKELDSYVEDIKKELPNIVREAIANYITYNLFNSINDINNRIQNGINDYISKNNGGY